MDVKKSRKKALRMWREMQKRTVIDLITDKNQKQRIINIWTELIIENEKEKSKRIQRSQRSQA